VVIQDTRSRKEALKRSKFRSRFKLDPTNRAYIQKIGLEKIRSHAEDLISKRLAPAYPTNDGKQTPFRGHPVFKAQHATATCCRGCLSKWYDIPKGRVLSEDEVDLLVGVLMDWIREKQEP
jgi:hypothetical protein